MIVHVMYAFSHKVHGIQFDDIDVRLTVKARWVDVGVGAYEFWGAKGTHHQTDVEWEIVGITCGDVVLEGEDLKYWSDAIYDRDDEDLHNRVYETASKECADEEPQ